MLNYPNQISRYAFGDKANSVSLTNAYSGNTKILGVGGMTQIEFYVQYTSATDNRNILIKLDFAPDDEDFYQSTYLTIDSTNNQRVVTQEEVSFEAVTNSVTYKFRFSEPLADKNLRISVKEDGSNNFGTFKLRYLLSGL